MNIEDFVNGIVGDNTANSIAATNNSERDGNVDDLLFRTSNPALGIGISGGTTVTSISPITALSDLGNGVISKAVLVWAAIILLVGYWLLKK